MKFTDRYVQNLKPQEARFEVLEGLGFLLRVTPSGRKTFCLAYQFEGRNRRMTLGSYPEISLAEARKKHAAAREQLKQGIDPGAVEQVAKAEAMAAPTVAALVEEYIERWAKPRKRTWPEDARMLNKDIVPRWGRRKAKEITRQDIVRMMDELQDRGATITTNRTLACVRKMFNWAVERGVLDASPCAGVRAPVQEVQRERVLSPDEIRAFWNGLDQASMSEGSRLALKLQFLTAARKGEVVTARWEDFDLVGGWWTLPAESSKNKMAHRVPLSRQSLEALERIKATSGDSPWLFPSRTPGKHQAPTSVDHAVRRNLATFGIGQFTPHDLRRTAASLMTGMGISRLVVSKVLNHVESGITAVYDRHGYDAEKRMALDAWGKRLEAIVTGQAENNVIALSSRQARAV
ncbi:MAG: tyrosine-type recombinase/integrase [Magnetococcales bacterium]|nr:tyrosine-type recombinase/integrase [Magnetococcales bacterium]MBF0116896.1 tyrosine-type recombinase/integrase [Magnetococcales bacterium]